MPLCPQYYATDTLIINKIPLSTILEEHLKADKQIGFLNIDAEGGNLEAAQSNDWAKFRPTLVLIESHARKGEADKLFFEILWWSNATDLHFGL